LLADHAARIAECEQREALAISEKEKAIKQAQEDFEERLQIVIRKHAKRDQVDQRDGESRDGELAEQLQEAANGAARRKGIDYQGAVQEGKGQRD
jgi:Na+-translocating ferredoxin:NAD+ oxidoreductase RnfC subunit